MTLQIDDLAATYGAAVAYPNPLPYTISLSSTMSSRLAERCRTQMRSFYPEPISVNPVLSIALLSSFQRSSRRVLRHLENFGGCVLRHLEHSGMTCRKWLLPGAAAEPDLVALVLVPALMPLLGDANSWMPRWTRVALRISDPQSPAAVMARSA